MQHWSDCTRRGGRERENVTRTSYGTYFPENLLLRRFPPKIVLRKSCPWKNFPGNGNWKEIVPWKSCPIKKLSLKKCVPKKGVPEQRRWRGRGEGWKVRWMAGREWRGGEGGEDEGGGGWRCKYLVLRVVCCKEFPAPGPTLHIPLSSVYRPKQCVPCIVYCTRYILYIVLYIVHILYCTVHIVHCIAYCTYWILHCTYCTLYCILYIFYIVLHIVYIV